MTVSELKITIQPIFNTPVSELRVAVIVDGIRHEVRQRLDPNDFESRFDSMMETAKREIIRMAKQQKK